MTQVRSRTRDETHRLEKAGARVRRFPCPGTRPSRVRSAIGVALALGALLGSLAAATLGPAFGEALPYPLLVLLMLIPGSSSIRIRDAGDPACRRIDSPHLLFEQ